MVTPDQIEVPEEMLMAYVEGYYGNALESKVWGMRHALAWLANNPIVPTVAESYELSGGGLDEFTTFPQKAAVVWQRRMFIKLQPELPQTLKEVIERHFGSNPAVWIKDVAREAYEIGLKIGGRS